LIGDRFKIKKTTYDERMLDAFQDLLLVFNMIHMLALDNICLFHGLDGILVLRLTLNPAYSHVTESA
jgi:hypothetical protein